MGKQAIANTLNENQIPSRKGKWHCFTVDYVLNNERYMGDALLQKHIQQKHYHLRERKIRVNVQNTI